jgi:hypothetical protein
VARALAYARFYLSLVPEVVADCWRDWRMSITRR